MYKKTQVTLKLTSGATPKVAKGHKVKWGDVILETTKTEVDEFDLARLLSLPPQKIVSCLTVKPHAQIKSGDVIARKKGIVSQQVVKSPVAGELVMVDETKGIVGIRRSIEGKKVTAWFSGTVEDIDGSCIVFGVSGKVLTGMAGRGTAVSGRLRMLGEVSALTMPVDIENAIVVVRKAYSDMIAKADALGAVAIVAEMIEPPPFSLPYLLLADIGEIAYHHEKWAVLNGDEKQLLIVADETEKHARKKHAAD